MSYSGHSSLPTHKKGIFKTTSIPSYFVTASLLHFTYKYSQMTEQFHPKQADIMVLGTKPCLPPGFNGSPRNYRYTAKGNCLYPPFSEELSARKSNIKISREHFAAATRTRSTAGYNRGRGSNLSWRETEPKCAQNLAGRHGMIQA